MSGLKNIYQSVDKEFSKDKENDNLQTPNPNKLPENYQEIENPELIDKRVDGNQPPKEVDFSSNISGNEQQRNMQSEREFNQQEDPLSTEAANQEYFSGEDLTEPDGFFTKIDKSISNGITEGIIGSTGDLGFGLVDLFTEENMFETDSYDRFRSSLETMKANDKINMSQEEWDELQQGGFSMKSFANPNFWSINVAEGIPQLAEFIFISKGVGGLAKKGLQKGLKKVVSKEARTQATTNIGKALNQGVRATEEVAGTGKNLGKLINTAGKLTETGVQVGETVGGGIGSNLFAGLLNASDTYKYAATAKSENGERLFSDQDAKSMAASVFQNNLAWMGVDMLSWGLTYSKGVPLIKKSLKSVSQKLQPGKTAQLARQRFSNQIKPIMKAAQSIGKAGLEGWEETFQETFEEWTKKRAIAEAKGEIETGAGEFAESVFGGDFLDFYNSKENEQTKAVSFALGALGGGVFGTAQQINERANENYKILKRSENLKTIWTKENDPDGVGLNYQNYHIREQMAEFILEDKADLYETAMNTYEQQGVIDPERRKILDESFEEMQAAYESSKKLNVKGKYALMREVASEKFYTEEMARLKEDYDASIEDVNSQEGMSETDRKNLIDKRSAKYKKQAKALALDLSQTKSNIAALKTGKKIDPDKSNTFYMDEYGNKVPRGDAGMTSKEYKEYVEDEIDVSKMPSEEDTPKSILKLKNLSKGARQVFEGFSDFIKSFSVDDIKEKASDIADKFKSKESSNSEQNSAEEVQQLRPKPTEEEAAAKKVEIAEKYKLSIKDTENGVTVEPTEGNNISDEDLNKAKQELYDAGINVRGYKPPQPENSSTGEAQSFENVEEDEAERAGREAKEKAEKAVRGAAKKAKETVERIKKSDLGKKIKDVSQSIYNKFKKEGTVSREVLENIADKESSNQPLTKEEVEIIEANNKAYQKILKDNGVIDEIIDTQGETIDVDYEDVTASRIKNKGKVDDEIGFESREKIQSDVTAAASKIKRVLKNKILQVENYIKQGQEVNKKEHSENIEKYLDGRIAPIRLGPNIVDKMVATNARMKEVFPGSNIKVYAVRDMYESLGVNAVGYAVANTIFIREDRWDQTRIGNHEMSHIYYSLNADAPQTKAMIKGIIENRKDLIENIKSKYPDYVLYEGLNGEVLKGSQVIGVANKKLSNESRKQVLKRMVNDGLIKEVPIEDQRLILEEAFVAELEGPLSEQYSRFYQKKNLSESRRKNSSRKWWSSIKRNATKNADYQSSTKSFLEKLNDGEPVPYEDVRQHILDNFVKEIAGKKVDAFGREARLEDKAQERVENLNEIDRIYEEQLKNIDNGNINLGTQDQFDELLDAMGIEDLTDDQAQIMFDENSKAFDKRAAKATKLINEFSRKYNRAVRRQYLKNPNGNNKPLLDRNLMFANILELAEKSNSSADFIYDLENSPYAEIKSFSKFLNFTSPENKYVLLSSMYFVYRNSSNIVGTTGEINSKGNYSVKNTLSRKETDTVQSILANIDKKRIAYQQNDDSLAQEKQEYQDFLDSYNAIKSGEEEKQDYLNLLKFFSNGSIVLPKVLDHGSINIKGQNHPIENVIKTFVKKGVMEKKLAGGKKLNLPSSYQALPLVEAIVSTNRRFTADSVIENAENNNVPSRIVKNNMIKELDGLYSDLQPKPGTKKIMSRVDFIKKYSHITGYGGDQSQNKFLGQIYDDYVNKGVKLEVNQYMGLKNLRNGNSSLYDTSTAIEQSMEDFMQFLDSKETNSYNANMGTFGDSPRKFFVRAPKQKFGKFFSLSEKGRVSFKNHIGTRNLMNGIYKIYQKIENNPLDKSKFSKQVLKDINDEMVVFENNAKSFSKINKLKDLYTNGKLNKKGREKVAEYVFNNMANGLYMAEVFSPNIKINSISKRLKNSASPVFAVNDNLKIEPIFYTDEFAGKSNRTDAGMYILEEDAEMWRNAGKGVMDLNNGFKFLNYSIEKDNINFKGKTALMKGYTTILNDEVVKQNPHLKGLYELMKERRQKYLENHREKFGVYPSKNLLDNTPNSFPIAIPNSSDKSEFIPNKLNNKDGSVTDYGSKFTLDNLNNDRAEANAELDRLMYFENDFIGVSAYNFGPQQIMDKKTEEVTTPVQLINSLFVNAAASGNLEIAERIQNLLRSEMQNNLNKELKQLENSSPEEFTAYVKKYVNKDLMDQKQRFLMETQGIFHPAVNEIVVNQIANQLKVAGNKLKTYGSYAHQKSDVGYRNPNGFEVNGSTELTTYGEVDGGLTEAGIILPAHMEKANGGEVRKREYITMLDYDGDISSEGLIDMMKKKNPAKYKKAENETSGERDMLILEEAVIGLAQQRFKKNGKALSEKEAKKKVGKVYRNKQHVGFYIKGDTVIATRVPSHGPSSTGVFEAVDFLADEGNQVIIPHENSKIMGSDLDGDALFIQAKNRTNGKANEAIDLIAEHWLSESMKDQIRTPMDFEERIDGVIKELGLKNSSSKNLPFTPQHRRQSYNNTMVAKRNVGTVFNLHRLMNIMAAYKTPLSEAVNVDSQEYQVVEDREVGENSRNQQSAVLANIILDNAKNQQADALGINEHTVSQAVLMTNLGMDIKQIAKILNSPVIKKYVEILDSNSSQYHDSKSKSQIIDEVYKTVLKNSKRKTSFGPIDTNSNSTENMANIFEYMMYLDKANSDLQKVSKIMAGHKGIETNPLLLQKEISDMNDVINGSSNSNQVVEFSDQFRNNPDFKSYLNVANEVLEKTKKANPVYNNSTNEMLKDLNEQLSTSGLSKAQIKRMSYKIKAFINSRMFGLNNISNRKYAELVDRSNPNNIFDRLQSHIDQLRQTEVYANKNKMKSVTAFDESLLFSKAISFNNSKNDPKIRLNPSFVNENLTMEEMEIINSEFEALPQELMSDLILYDLLQNGWSSNLSLSSVFGDNVNSLLNSRGEEAFKNSNATIPGKVMNELKHKLALTEMNGTPGLPQVTISQNDINTKNVRGAIAKGIVNDNQDLVKHLIEGKGSYLKVNLPQGRGKQPISKLYYFEGVDMKQRSQLEQMKPAQQANYIAKEFSKKVKSLESDFKIQLQNKGNLDFINIKDSSTGYPFYYDVNPNEDTDEVGMEMREEFWNYTDEKALFEEEFNNAMEYDKYDTDAKKRADYEQYLKDKEEANRAAKKINSETVKGLSDEELFRNYENYGNKNLIAFGIVTEPITTEIAKRASEEQSKITGRYENGKDIDFFKSWLMSNNIPSNHPATQALVRQMEVEFKKFSAEKSKYTRKINKATDELYMDKFGFSPNSKTPLNLIKRIWANLIYNKKNLFETLYGNLVDRETVKLPDGKEKTDFKLKTEKEVKLLLKNGNITQAEYNFYKVFKETTNDLKPFSTQKAETKQDYIPHTSMSRMEQFANRGILGLFVNSKGDERIYDVKMFVTNPETGKKELKNFHEIEAMYNVLAKVSGNDIGKIREFHSLKRKALRLMKKGKNEDGSNLEQSVSSISSLLGTGAINRFSNNRSVKSQELPSMDLNKALNDYVHSTLFVNGNENFQGFQKKQALVDGILAMNDKKSYNNLNKYVKTQWKDYFLKGEKQSSLPGPVDKTVDLMTKLGLFYYLGYKGFLIGKGMYAVGNIAAGKYHNIKNGNAKEWIQGEKRFWGLDGNSKNPMDILERHRRSQKILKNIGFMDINIYDDVNVEKKNSLDGVLSDIALMPMAWSEKWIQGVQMMGMMSEEEMNKFDDKGDYKEYETPISFERIAELENTVKNSQGKGYQPTDQRMVQMYSWGRMLMQFSRHLPTMFHDRFAKSDIDIYGKEHIGSLRAVGNGLNAAVQSMSPQEFINYRNNLSDAQRKRFDSGLKGMAISSVALALGLAGSNSANSFYWDANYYMDSDRLAFKTTPPGVRATKDIINDLF